MDEEHEGVNCTIDLDPECVLRIQNLRLQKRVCELEMERLRSQLLALDRQEEALADEVRKQLGDPCAEIIVDLDRAIAFKKTT